VTVSWIVAEELGGHSRKALTIEKCPRFPRLQAIDFDSIYTTTAFVAYADAP
jgi:hypothetical protein